MTVGQCCKCEDGQTSPGAECQSKPEVGCASLSAPPPCGACARIKHHETTAPPSCCPHTSIFPRVLSRSPKAVEKKGKKPGKTVLYEKTNLELGKTKMSTIELKFDNKVTKASAPRSYTWVGCWCCFCCYRSWWETTVLVSYCLLSCSYCSYSTRIIDLLLLCLWLLFSSLSLSLLKSVKVTDTTCYILKIH